MKPIEPSALTDLLMINHCYYDQSTDIITTLSTPNYTAYLSETIKKTQFLPLINLLSTINKLLKTLPHYKKTPHPNAAINIINQNQRQTCNGFISHSILKL